MATSAEAAALAAAEAAKARKFKQSIKAMKSVVLEVQLILYEGVRTDEQLHAAGRLLAQSEYGDVVEERYIAKVCGYPRCENELPVETRKGRYRISLSAKKVYDLEESRHFCSPACLIASKDFGKKLPLQQDLVELNEHIMKDVSTVRGSQYVARLKDKPPARPRNARRGKARPKDTKIAVPTSSEVPDRAAGRPVLAEDLNMDNGKNSLITPRVEHSNSAAANPSSAFQNMPSSSDDTFMNRQLQVEKDSPTSTSFSSTVQTNLKIQERVGNQTVLPIFDYGGPSDAIEGYVPLRSSSRKAISHAEHERADSSDLGRKDTNLKPALKKQPKVKKNSRSVSWTDESKLNAASSSGNSELKERSIITNADETPKNDKASEDVSRLEETMKSLGLEEPQRGTRLSESTTDLAMAARLASAEAIAAALTEAATSAAAGEVDGSEAVAQAGLSILSATHNANSARTESSSEAQDESGEVSESMDNTALDEDELFARAAQAREEMRRQKMPRKYDRMQDDEDVENGDVIGNLNSITEDDDADDDDDNDVAEDGNDDDPDSEERVHDDYYDDDYGGLEGAREVGFTAPPKGFKAEVSMFGTTFMALEAWISAASVAHIYGKEPHQEDEYFSVNGREYPQHTVTGDGTSAEILRTFSLCICRAMPEVVRALRISVPLSTLELALGRLLKTMRFVEALPPFGTKQWRMLVILLLDALSIHRLPRLGVHFSNNRTMLRQVLDSTGTSEAEYDVFRDVVLPLGRSPTFASRSGG